MHILVRYRGIRLLEAFAIVLLAIQSCSLHVKAAATLAYPCTIAWSASTDPDVRGYAVYYGLAGSAVTNRFDAGTNDSATFFNLKASSGYFFYAVSYNAAGIESRPTEMLYYAPPALSRLQINLLKNGAVSVQFRAATNAACHLEYTSILAAHQWEWLDSSTADANGDVTITDAQAILSPGRLYRAVEP